MICFRLRILNAIFKYCPYLSKGMQNKKQEKIYFDEFTAEKPWKAFTDKTYKKIAELFLEYLNPKKDDNIIDMGCGTGEFTKKIRGLSFKKVQGFDISKKCIQLAKKQYKNIIFKVGDIENMELKKNSADVLIYCGILHHFTNLKKVVKEANRILKKNGKIFVFEPNALNPVLWLFRNKKSPVKSTKLKTPNEEFLTKKQIREAFQKEGFKIVKLEGVSGISYTRSHFKKILPFPFFYLVHVYNLFDGLLNKTFLKSRYGSFIFGYIEKD